MPKLHLRLVAALAILFATASLHAQSGCFHSPEARTDVLLLVGSAGMFYGSSILTRVIRRRRNVHHVHKK